MLRVFSYHEIYRLDAGKSSSPIILVALPEIALAAWRPEITADSMQPGVLKPFRIQSPVKKRFENVEPSAVKRNKTFP